jgi:hypothetical protein
MFGEQIGMTLGNMPFAFPTELDLTTEISAKK